MDRYNPEFLKALGTIAKHLLGQSVIGLVDAKITLRKYFKSTDEAREAAPYLNHKCLWPAQIRVIVRYVMNGGQVTDLTEEDCEWMIRLVKDLGPSS